MDGLTTILAAIASAVGLLWVLGLGASFLAGVCESAKPPAEEGEPPLSNGALGAAGAVASFLTPFIL
ncbi:MAG: hypothetical protein ABUS57_06940, partial [Pseudomonadota bacterium]